MGSFRYVGLAVLTARGRGAVAEGVELSCHELVGLAKPLTPVDTGQLQSSIHVDSVVTSGLGVVGTVVADTDYAVFVERGTYKMEGSHFLTIPLVENAERWADNIAKAARAAF